MKHEYTADELAKLKSIYDESGEAGLQIGEMRALRKAGLLTQDLPPKPHEDTLADYAISVPKPKPEPVKLESTNTNCNPETRQAVYDTIAEFCSGGHVPTIQKIADAMHKSKSTVANHVLALAKEGRISKDPETGSYRTTNPTKTTETTEKKESTIMTTTVQAQKPEAKPEEPRIIIANALVGIFDAISALQKTAFQTNDKVVYGFATKLLNGELMDLKANYSKDTAK